MVAQNMQHSAGFYDPMSQYQQYGLLSQEQQLKFMMQASQYPQAPPGTFAVPQQQDAMTSSQQDGPTVITQTVFVPYPCSMPQVGPHGFAPMADPWHWSGSAAKGPKGKHGAAARKKTSGALRSDEVHELKRAVHDKMQVYPGKFKSDCSTAAGSSDAEGSCQTPPENFDQDSSKNSPQFDVLGDRADTALMDLDSANDMKRQGALQWVSQSFWLLAMHKKGCRAVQKAVDVGTPAYQVELLANLHGYVTSAVESPHANYVLQKFIQIAPPEQIQFIVDEVQDNLLYIARHRFGCRILQRLLEHCKPWQTQQLISKALEDAASLCRHQYGNFILQHILQYGSPSQRSAIADVVLADIFRLSKHRLASHIVSCALVNCSPQDVRRLTHAVLHDEAELMNLSRREYGSFVVREVHRAARLLETGGIKTIEEVPNESDDVFCTQDLPSGFARQCTADSAQGMMRQFTADSAQGMMRQFTVEMERQPTMDAYMDAIQMNRQCTAGAYMD